MRIRTDEFPKRGTRNELARLHVLNDGTHIERYEPGRTKANNIEVLLQCAYGGMDFSCYAYSMVAKITYATNGDKKLMKKLAKEMKPALISLAKK